ncbi:hypothetical protein HDU81_006781 [Chytriomyces hyalinus]|nr:hypothetical protein HDU81_006781 [Chytriomyces hyalinus]
MEVKKIGIPKAIADVTSAAPSATESAIHDQSQRDIRIYSQYFRRYELLIEYKNLRNPDHCPHGMYIMPEADNLNEWWGVLLLHRGYYKEGVFKFHVQIPEDYPSEGPIVRFTTDMFHPLVDRSGFFNMRQQFPAWRANKDFICHLLHYIKNSFKEAVLANLEESNCPNRDAYNMFMYERPLFAKLASQCAQLSASDGILFSNDLEEDESIIKFRQLDDAEFEKLKAEMLLSVNVESVDRAMMAHSSGNQKNDLLRDIKSVTGNISRMLSTYYAKQGDRLEVEAEKSSVGEGVIHSHPHSQAAGSDGATGLGGLSGANGGGLTGQAKPLRSMIATAFRVSGGTTDYDPDDAEDFVYAPPNNVNRAVNSSNLDTDFDPNDTPAATLNSYPPTDSSASNLPPVRLPLAVRLSTAATTNNSPQSNATRLRKKIHKHRHSNQTNYLTESPSSQSPGHIHLSASFSSSTSSMSVGADYLQANDKKRAAALQQNQQILHPHYTHYNVIGSASPVSPPTSSYYSKPVLQKRFRGGNSSSSARSASDAASGACINGSYFKGHGVVTPTTLHDHEYFKSKSVNGGSNGHNLYVRHTSGGVPVNERTHLLSGTLKKKSSATGLAAGNLEIDAGGGVTVSVSVSDDAAITSVGRPLSIHGVSTVLRRVTVWSFCSTLITCVFIALTLMVTLTTPLTPVSPSNGNRTHPVWILPTETWHPHVTRVSNATAKLYAFEFELMAVNWGLVWNAVVASADLEVFVEASGVIPEPDDGGGSHRRSSDEEGVVFSESGGQRADSLASRELLAHVTVLDVPAVFGPHSITLNATARVAIDHPKSTVGKIIYMNYPYQLLLTGSVRYVTAFGMFTRSIPVCSSHLVLNSRDVRSRSCELSPAQSAL